MTSDKTTGTVLDSSRQPARGTYEDRRSEFIGEICHIEGADDALRFVQSVRDRNPKARHVAYAAMWGTGGASGERMSDDGEPSGTAGKPILDVLRANALTDCVVTVTRYFGGILLGSGGLIRAYSNAATAAVAAAKHARIVDGRELSMTVPYAWYEQVVQLVRTSGGTVAHEEFTDAVAVTAHVPAESAGAFVSRLREMTAATVEAEDLGAVHEAVPVER
ncbi:MAG: YigZ family protein [Bifidobacteriaceae bacterium]|nr:YigZ family protein [Bifidobacteriaceae bacterium]